MLTGDEEPWQTIRTAPRDGTPIRGGLAHPVLAFIGVAPVLRWLPTLENERVTQGAWHAFFGEPHGWQPCDPQPTHWRPLKNDDLRPIDIAPRDGTTIHVPVSFFVRVFWDTELKQWTTCYEIKINSVANPKEWKPA